MTTLISADALIAELEAWKADNCECGEPACPHYAPIDVAITIVRRHAEREAEAIKRGEWGYCKYRGVGHVVEYELVNGLPAPPAPGGEDQINVSTTAGWIDAYAMGGSAGEACENIGGGGGPTPHNDSNTGGE